MALDKRNRVSKTMGSMHVELCDLLKFSSLVRSPGSFVLDHLGMIAYFSFAICSGRGWHRVRTDGIGLGDTVYHRDFGFVELDRGIIHGARIDAMGISFP